MNISSVEKRRKSFCAVFLDGEFAANIDLETFLKSGLRVGQDISEEEFERLVEASQARRANEKALYLLEHRSHSKKELIDKIRRTTTLEAAQSAADRMESLGLIDDEDYARRYAAELLSRKRYSASRAIYELTCKGIDRAFAEDVVDELAGDPEDSIRTVIERKYLRCLGDEKGVRRTVNALQRLGYRYDEIRPVLAEFLQDGGSEFDGE